MSIGVPRSHFTFRPGPGYLFIAGGIGITPILLMLKAAKAMRLDYRLIYLGSSHPKMASLEKFGRQSLCTDVA